MSVLTGIVRQLADDDIDPETGHGPEWGKAAPIALLVIVLLAIALVFLLKSMNTQLRKVPATFDPSAGGALQDPLDTSPGTGTGSGTGTDVAETPAGPATAPAVPPDPGDAPPGR